MLNSLQVNFTILALSFRLKSRIRPSCVTCRKTPLQNPYCKILQSDILLLANLMISPQSFESLQILQYPYVNHAQDWYNSSCCYWTVQTSKVAVSIWITPFNLEENLIYNDLGNLIQNDGFSPISNLFKGYKLFGKNSSVRSIQDMRLKQFASVNHQYDRSEILPWNLNWYGLRRLAQ